jgi:hypothetical protein
MDDLDGMQCPEKFGRDFKILNFVKRGIKFNLPVFLKQQQVSP